MIGHYRSRNAHQFRDMAEAADVYSNGGDTDGLDRSLDVSDRHVADRSNGHEKDGVDAVIVESFRPSGCALLA